MTQVLVTRPEEAGQALAGHLQAEGLAAVVMPFYTFESRTPGIEVEAVWPQDGQRKVAVFTSPRAVDFGLQFLPGGGRDSGLQLAVVGAATRASLEAAGLAVHIQASSGYTSEDLLRAPDWMENPGVAVIFCAPDGRETLAEGLQALGWRVEKAMVYERVALEPDPAQLEKLRQNDGLISVWTSISALKLAQQYLPRDVWGRILEAPALVISSRIRQHLKQQGAGFVELADGPGNDDLLRSILRLARQRTSG
jgi:uroporphyrinogen-III synthase